MSVTLDNIALPDDLIWTDEFGFDVVAQSQRRTISGALVITESPKIKGRPFTLDGQGNSWMTREDLLALKVLSNQVDQSYVLVFNGESYVVMFNRASGSAIQPTQIKQCSDPSAQDPYTVKINFIEIDATSIGSGSVDVGFVGLGSGTI